MLLNLFGIFHFISAFGDHNGISFNLKQEVNQAIIILETVDWDIPKQQASPVTVVLVEDELMADNVYSDFYQNCPHCVCKNSSNHQQLVQTIILCIV